MRIAYIYDAVYPYRIGGVERRIYELAWRLAERGHEVHVYGIKEWDGASSFEKDGVFYHGIGNALPFYVNGRRAVREAVSFGWSALKPLLRERFDIIDCQNFPYFNCFSMAFISWVKGNPLIITWHEVWGDYWYEYLGNLGFFGKLVEKMTSKLSTHVVAVSEVTKKNFSSLGCPDYVTVIYNGIDLKKLDSISHSDLISDIFFAGRLVKEKNVDLLVRSVEIIKRGLPGIRVFIVGEGPEMGKLRNLVQQCDLDNNISFLGVIPDSDTLISLMKSSKLFASPSIREGFGMAAAEALACGLPLVTCNAPENAVKDLIDEKTGIISNRTPEAFAGAILEVLMRRDEMTLDCKNLARRYDWEKIVAEIEDYYMSVVSGQSR